MLNIDHREIEEKVKQMVEEIINDEPFSLMKIELKSVKFSGIPGNYKLQVFLDKPGGITIDDCYAINEELSVKLDVEDIIPTKYVLEVSSPGIDKNIPTDQLFKEAMEKRKRRK